MSVLCPGFVRTAILQGGGKYGKMLIDLSPEQERRLLEMIEKFRPMSPNVFAKKALNQVAKNRAIVILPSWWTLFWWIHRLFPSLGIFLAQKRFQDFQKKLHMPQES